MRRHIGREASLHRGSVYSAGLEALMYADV
jgi:hypothetical protein